MLKKYTKVKECKIYHNIYDDYYFVNNNHMREGILKMKTNFFENFITFKDGGFHGIKIFF